MTNGNIMNNARPITNIQEYLRELSYHDPDIPRVNVDGIFGDETREAVIAFQNKNKLPPSGEVDRATWDRLYAAYLDAFTKHTPPKFISVFPRNPENYELSPGDSYFLVNILQFMLREISAEHNFDPEVEISGVYDESTERAVRMFQRRSMIQQSGRVNRETWDRLADYFNIMQNEYYQ